MNDKQISIESIYKEGQLHAKIAELSQIIVKMAQEIEILKHKKEEDV